MLFKCQIWWTTHSRLSVITTVLPRTGANLRWAPQNKYQGLQVWRMWGCGCKYKKCILCIAPCDCWTPHICELYGGWHRPWYHHPITKSSQTLVQMTNIILLWETEAQVCPTWSVLHDPHVGQIGLKIPKIE